MRLLQSAASNLNMSGSRSFSRMVDAHRGFRLVASSGGREESRVLLDGDAAAWYLPLKPGLMVLYHAGLPPTTVAVFNCSYKLPALIGPRLRQAAEL